MLSRICMVGGLALSLALVACSHEKDGKIKGESAAVPSPNMPSPDMPGAAIPEGQRRISFSAEGLQPLGTGFVYEGWLITASGAEPAGRFAVDEAGAAVPPSFLIPATVADGASNYVLTIEPEFEDDPAPSDTHVIAGPITNGSAMLTVADAMALGDDFSGAMGTFFLGTPTSAATDDDNMGIWFLNPPVGDGDPTPSLSLPTLPAGWVYEGWVVDTSTPGTPVPITTGRFTSASGPDSDAGGPGAGDLPAPPFPGSDFVAEGYERDLSQNHMAVISIEPEPDDSPAPFQLKPLGVAIANLVGGANPQTLDNIIEMNTITGRVTIE